MNRFKKIAYFLFSLFTTPFSLHSEPTSEIELIQQAFDAIKEDDKEKLQTLLKQGVSPWNETTVTISRPYGDDDFISTLFSQIIQKKWFDIAEDCIQHWPVLATSFFYFEQSLIPVASVRWLVERGAFFSLHDLKKYNNLVDNLRENGDLTQEKMYDFFALVVFFLKNINSDKINVDDKHTVFKEILDEINLNDNFFDVNLNNIAQAKTNDNQLMRAYDLFTLSKEYTILELPANVAVFIEELHNKDYFKNDSLHKENILKPVPLTPLPHSQKPFFCSSSSKLPIQLSILPHQFQALGWLIDTLLNFSLIDAERLFSCAELIRSEFLYNFVASPEDKRNRTLIHAHPYESDYSTDTLLKEIFKISFDYKKTTKEKRFELKKLLQDNNHAGAHALLKILHCYSTALDLGLRIENSDKIPYLKKHTDSSYCTCARESIVEKTKCIIHNLKRLNGFKKVAENFYPISDQLSPSDHVNKPGTAERYDMVASSVAHINKAVSPSRYNINDIGYKITRKQLKQITPKNTFAEKREQTRQNALNHNFRVNAPFYFLKRENIAYEQLKIRIKARQLLGIDENMSPIKYPVPHSRPAPSLNDVD